MPRDKVGGEGGGREGGGGYGGENPQERSDMEQPLDPRMEKLIGLLYEELPEAEAAEVRRWLEEDPDLRREWDELTSTRTMLAEWEVVDRTPSFVFLDDPAAHPAGRPARGAASATERAEGWLARLRDRMRGSLVPLPWAVATAGVIVAALALADFHVERQGGSLTLRFGESPIPRSTTRMMQGPGGVEEAVPLTPQGNANGGGAGQVAPQNDNRSSYPAGEGSGIGLVNPPRSESGGTPVSDDGTKGPGARPANAYVTKGEFEAYAAGITQAMAALLNEYSRQRDQQTGELLDTAFRSVAERHTQDYEALQRRIDELGAGLTEEQFRTKVQLETLLRQSQGGDSASKAGTPLETGAEGARP